LFLAGMGVIGIIIAFAAQDTLSNFFAGLHIMLDRPFQVGDLIEIEPGVITEVMDIGLRSTKLYWGKEHDVLIIPNKEIANKKIVNYLRPDYRFKTNVKVGVAYGSDLRKVEEVMRDVARAHPDVLSEGEEYEPLFRVNEFGDSAIEVLIIFWVEDARKQWGTRSDITRDIERRFKEEGIVIPFPQRDVWSRQPASGREGRHPTAGEGSPGPSDPAD
ncbi:MAG: mechanosensitive ion channel family protein, partial [Thermoplasmata archaeon]|nr:mechanosensitive ion channel family protein [Thermoplasmata archaeon]